MKSTKYKAPPLKALPNPSREKEPYVPPHLRRGTEFGTIDFLLICVVMGSIIFNNISHDGQSLVFIYWIALLFYSMFRFLNTNTHDKPQSIRYILMFLLAVFLLISRLIL